MKMAGDHRNQACNRIFKLLICANPEKTTSFKDSTHELKVKKCQKVWANKPQQSVPGYWRHSCQVGRHTECVRTRVPLPGAVTDLKVLTKHGDLDEITQQTSNLTIPQKKKSPTAETSPVHEHQVHFEVLFEDVPLTQSFSPDISARIPAMGCLGKKCFLNCFQACIP